MSTQTLITARQFEKMAETLGPCELVRGEVVTLSPGGLWHNRIVANTTGILRDWAKRTGLGREYVGDTGLIVQRGPDTVRGADVAFYSYERLPRDDAPKGFSDLAPNLVAEVIGRGQGWPELLRKTSEYLNMGVDRVWIIDPRSQRVHVYRPDSEPTVFSLGDTIADDAVLPGFQCKVEEFFAG